ncbi:MAG: hypothetical protein ACFFCW_13605 [Candidatus Hodarchaeota archaeon]
MPPRSYFVRSISFDKADIDFLETLIAPDFSKAVRSCIRTKRDFDKNGYWLLDLSLPVREAVHSFLDELKQRNPNTNLDESKALECIVDQWKDSIQKNDELAAQLRGAHHQNTKLMAKVRELEQDLKIKTGLLGGE